MSAAIPSWAVRGAKVVCVDGFEDAMAPYVIDPDRLMVYPQIGTVYTIREVRVRFVTEYGDVMVGVLLHELHNPKCTGGSATGEETAWWVGGFRPLTSIDNDVEARIFNSKHSKAGRAASPSETEAA